MADRKFSEAEVEFFLKEERVVDLVHLVIDGVDSCNCNRAAEKLITMWKDDRRGGVDPFHLSIVAEHAEEPYRSEAKMLYSDYLK